jgi:hypothetical protein
VVQLVQLWVSYQFQSVKSTRAEPTPAFPNRRYTSLGSTFNTIPNPLLRDPSQPSGWKPAWELEDASAERAGRPAGPIPVEVAKTLDRHTYHENGQVTLDEE